MNHKTIFKFWLVVLLTSVGILLMMLSLQAQEPLKPLDDLTLAVSDEASSFVEAVSIPQAAEPVSPAYEAESWVNLGGPPGGLGYDVRMVPDDPDVMYVTSSPNGVAKSTDGGKTWSYINEGIKPLGSGTLRWVFCATIDPHDYDTVWIGTQFDSHIYRSTDAGQTWELRDNGIISKTGEHSVRGITIDPNNPDIIYAGIEDFPAGTGLGPVWGEVYKSTDRGENWTRIWYGDNLARYVWVDPTNSQRVYVSTGIFDRIANNEEKGVGILRSDDGGTTWEVLSETHGLGGLYIPSLYMHPVTPTILLAAVSSAPAGATAPGVYVTYDGGDTWEQVLMSSVEAVEISDKDPDVWYAAADGVFFRSDDAGETWQDFPLFAGGRRSGNPIDLQVDPRDEYRVFVNSYNGGNMVSTDGGETWADASQGYTGAWMMGVAVSPETGARAFAAGSRTFFRSDDGGRAWTGVITKVINAIAVQPGSDGSRAHIMATSEDGDVYHSTDGGNTWTPSQVADIAALKASGQISDMAYIAWAFGAAPSDPQTVYLGYADTTCWWWDFNCAGHPPGFFRSHDGGYTWEHVASTPFSDVSILNLAVSHETSSTLYAATMSGVYRSQDSGDTWQHLNQLEASAPPPPGTPVAFAVATDPFSPGIVYAGTPYAGVYRSLDSGDTWEPMLAGLDPNEPIFDLLPDPNREGLLYASSHGSGVFYSTDRGELWQRAADSPQLMAKKLALSEDGSVLYVGTYGEGVFRLGTPVTTTLPNTPPTAQFNVSPSAGDTDTVFSFDGSGSSDTEDPTSALKVRWDWEDDGTYDTSWSTTKAATHTFAASGTHTIRMEVRDTGGLTDNTPRQAEVVEASSNTPPTAAFDVTPDSGDVATAFAFDASASSDAEDATPDLQVRWDWTDDGVYDTGWSTSKTLTHVFATSDTHTIRMEVRDTGGLTADTTRQVTVTGTSANAPPTAVFNVSPSAGETDTVFFFDGSGSSDAEDPPWTLEVRWDWTDDGIYDTGWSTTKAATHTYAVTGIHTIRMEVRDSGGLADNTPRQVMVMDASPNTPPTASFVVTPTIGDIATEFTFDGSGSSDAEDPLMVLEVRWDWEDDGIYDTGWSGDKTMVHTFATIGEHTVRMEVRDGGDLADSTTRAVTVTGTSANTPPTASFSVTPDSGDTTTEFLFDGSGSSDAEDPLIVLEVRWDWENDGVYDVDWSGNKTISHTFATADTYTVRMQVRDGGDLTDSTTRTVTVVEAGGDHLVFLPLVVRGN